MNSPLAKKSVRRERLHTEFEELLKRIQPNEKLLNAFQYNLEKQSAEYEKDKGLILKTYNTNLKCTEEKIHRYIERI
jgi:tRNA nucleotidyltransferase/poly(A) polymerase